MVTIDGYPLDLVETEEHSLTSEITDHPVEDGSDISDNIRLKPRELTLTNAVVSNTPIGAIATDDTRKLGASLPPPAMAAYQRLEALWLARKTFTVVTGLKKYEKMGIVTLTIPQEAKNAGGLIFTVHLKEIRVATNKRVTMAVPNAGGEQNLGLSLDHLVEGQKVLWRKGKPPGTSPATTPAGVITGQEVVTVRQSSPGKHAKFLHESGTPLTSPELDAFTKDLNRDTSLLTDRGLARAQQSLDNIGNVLERDDKMATYETLHPGEHPDPSQFGLSRDPSGHWTAK